MQMLRPWCHPYCLSILQKKDHFLLVVVPRGNHPPVPTCRCARYACSRLSSVSRSRRRFEKEGSIPNFHSVSDRCWVPLSYSVRSTRVSVYDFVCIKHAS